MTEQAGAFDPSTFLNATISQANTRRPPIPAGTVLQGTLGEPKINRVVGKQEKNLGVVYFFLEIPVEVDLTTNPTLRDKIGQDKVMFSGPSSFKGSMDFTPQGGLDTAPGKNNTLRILREALGMNQDGQDFSIMMAQGRTVLAQIKNDPDQNDPNTIWDRIQTITKVG